MANPDYSDLNAAIINCTLTRSPEPSHTDTLLDIPRKIMAANGVTTTNFRAVDHDIAPGVYPDMTKKGVSADDWPTISTKVLAADILIIGTPLWLGDKSSIATRIVERLYAHSGEFNAKGQYVFYGKVGGCVVTGNEDGIKHAAMNLLYSMQHIGFTIPPAADCGWIGEAGPGPSYGDEREDGPPVGFDNDFTNRNATFMTWNLLHMARMLKDAGGIPAHGNVRKQWDAGTSLDFPNPEYR